MNPVITLWYTILLSMLGLSVGWLEIAIVFGCLGITVSAHALIVTLKGEFIEEMHLNNTEYRVVQIRTHNKDTEKTDVEYHIQHRLLFPIGWGIWTAQVIHLKKYSYALRSSVYGNEADAIAAVRQLREQNKLLFEQKKVDRASKRNSRTVRRVVHWWNCR